MEDDQMEVVQDEKPTEKSQQHSEGELVREAKFEVFQNELLGEV